MLPSSHQPAKFFASPKTHKFDDLSDINVTNLNCDQSLSKRGHVTTKQENSYQNI